MFSGREGGVGDPLVERAYELAPRSAERGAPRDGVGHGGVELAERGADDPHVGLREEDGHAGENGSTGAMVAGTTARGVSPRRSFGEGWPANEFAKGFGGLLPSARAAAGREVGGRKLGMAERHRAPLEQQPAEPSDGGALVALRLPVK